jgi:hypothetical protein
MAEIWYEGSWKLCTSPEGAEGRAELVVVVLGRRWGAGGAVLSVVRLLSICTDAPSLPHPAGVELKVRYHHHRRRRTQYWLFSSSPLYFPFLLTSVSLFPSHLTSHYSVPSSSTLSRPSTRPLNLQERFMIDLSRDPLFKIDDIHDLTKAQIRERTMAKL